MANENGYNGWSNYETWCANLWLTNYSGGCDWLEENARECLQRAIDDDETDIKSAAAYALADQLQEFHQDFYPDVKGVFADLLQSAFGAIDWNEIATNHIGGIDLYVAGWNVPGYMPDTPPSVFMDADDALAYLRDAVRDLDLEIYPDAEAWADDMAADKNGEFGQSIANYHYFVTKA